MDPRHDSPSASVDGNVLIISGEITASTIGDFENTLSGLYTENITVVDGSGISRLDSSGAYYLNKISGGHADFRGFGKRARKLIDISVLVEHAEAETREKTPRMTFERLGGLALREFERITEIAILVIDIIYWSVIGLFDRKQYRKGSFVEQAFIIGASALPIVGTILFLIGVILTLQSFAQLRQFGVGIYVVNMLSIGLSREFAPLMTAIIISGRSGSAIASEIATMKFTEELDAIKTLGLNPIRFVIVPKFWAMIISMPLLTVMALFIGLFGGFLVTVTYMELTPSSFMNQLFLSLMFRDIAAGLIKSVSFAIIITIVGAYRGLNFTGGADGVGRATTSSVVTSIFLIIVMDSIWGLIFYFKV